MIITLTQEGREPVISKPTMPVQNLTGMIAWLYNHKLLPKQLRERKRVLVEIASPGLDDTPEQETYICRFGRSVPSSTRPASSGYAMAFDEPVTVTVQRYPTVICQYCQRPARLAESSEIYGRDYGKIWLCDPCDAYVGVHRNSCVHKPKGTLAKRDLREWRRRAHQAFDPLWTSQSMSRTDAYQRLQEIMGLSQEDAHIAMFTIEQCRMLIDKLEAEVPSC